MEYNAANTNTIVNSFQSRRSLCWLLRGIGDLGDRSNTLASRNIRVPFGAFYTDNATCVSRAKEPFSYSLCSVNTESTVDCPTYAGGNRLLFSRSVHFSHLAKPAFPRFSRPRTDRSAILASSNLNKMIYWIPKNFAAARHDSCFYKTWSFDYRYDQY